MNHLYLKKYALTLLLLLQNFLCTSYYDDGLRYFHKFAKNNRELVDEYYKARQNHLDTQVHKDRVDAHESYSKINSTLNDLKENCYTSVKNKKKSDPSFGNGASYIDCDTTECSLARKLEKEAKIALKKWEELEKEDDESQQYKDFREVEKRVNDKYAEQHDELKANN